MTEWSEEKIDLLKKLWPSSASMEYIKAVLRMGVPAISGKARRLGLVRPKRKPEFYPMHERVRRFRALRESK